MIIQHNIPALNSYRQLSGNNNALAKNLEKLSSGYKVNRAGDDAAGLAISEKMRAQIKGLETASKNAQDGISVIQTAEGALTEVHSMLNRMVELATQAANGIYGSEERANIQAEIDKLNQEIDRIGNNTDFNGTKLLDGSLGELAFTTTTDGANGITQADVKIIGGNFGTVAGASTLTITGAVTQAGVGVALTTFNGAAGTAGVTFSLTSKSGDNTKGSLTFAAVINDAVATAAEKAAFEGMSITVNHNTLLAANDVLTIAGNTSGTGMTLQVGDTVDQKITLGVSDMRTAALGVNVISVASVDTANSAIDTIKTGISKVSTQRANLGALQNRLEHTINNLGVTTENITAAESRIRDTDMAKEMMAYTKNNILVQAAQAMLAQANQVPQGVLQLLR